MGKAPKNNEDSKEDKMSSFREDAANKIGVTPRTIQRLTKVGRLPDDIKDLVRDTALIVSASLTAGATARQGSGRLAPWKQEKWTVKNAPC